MDILILILLILFNGVFAMSEIALVTARRNRLEEFAEGGDKAARAALTLGEHPTRFLSTIQIGITAIGILSGVFGEAALAAPLASWLQGLGLSRVTASTAATAGVVVVITYFSIILGELVPKRIAQRNAEGIARLVARPITLLAAISHPFVLLLSLSTDAVLRLFGKERPGSAALTEKDIQDMLSEGALSGIIEKREHDMVRNVLRLDDRQIASLMTPRNEIVWLDADDSEEAVLQTVTESGLSRFPVCRGGLDSIAGIITAKILLKQYAAHTPLDITHNLRPPVYVPESLTAMRLLEHFQESGVQLVFVVDEYGSVIGLITLQDVLVALVGEFKPHDPEDIWAIQREDGSWLLDGMIPIPELKDRLGLKTLPEEEKSQYNTLGGLIMCLAGAIPRIGEKMVWEGWEFEVVDLDGNRVDKVLATRRL